MKKKEPLKHFDDELMEMLIEKGILIPPENGIGAEGCRVTVKK